MAKDKSITKKLAFYKRQRKKGLTVEDARKNWEKKLEAEKVVVPEKTATA